LAYLLKLHHHDRVADLSYPAVLWIEIARKCFFWILSTKNFSHSVVQYIFFSIATTSASCLWYSRQDSAGAAQKQSLADHVRAEAKARMYVPECTSGNLVRVDPRIKDYGSKLSLWHWVRASGSRWSCNRQEILVKSPSCMTDYIMHATVDDSLLGTTVCRTTVPTNA
jgi:hypothetical protein